LVLAYKVDSGWPGAFDHGVLNEIFLRDFRDLFCNSFGLDDMGIHSAEDQSGLALVEVGEKRICSSFIGPFRMEDDVPDAQSNADDSDFTT